jgi:hypothetical protein
MYTVDASVWVNGLRGADAVYATVAMEAGTTLVSLDGEHLMRLATVMTVVTPAAALASITLEPDAETTR